MTRLLPCAALVLLSACSGVKVQTRSIVPEVVDQVATYAWQSEPLFDVKPEVDAALRDAIDDAFAARGLRAVSLDEADAVLSHDVDFELDLRTGDPYFWYTHADRWEIAVVTLELADAGTSVPIWSSTGRMTLREVAKTIGTGHVRLVDVERERDWRVETLAEGLVSEFPARL